LLKIVAELAKNNRKSVTLPGRLAQVIVAGNRLANFSFEEAIIESGLLDNLRMKILGWRPRGRFSP